jgi:hypothetical protein
MTQTNWRAVLSPLHGVVQAFSLPSAGSCAGAGGIDSVALRLLAYRLSVACTTY